MRFYISFLFCAKFSFTSLITNMNVTNVLLSTKKFSIHGINPELTCIETGSKIELPRFSSVEMQTARALNIFSKNNLYRNFSERIPQKASKSDIKRLTSTNFEDTYNRALWINPKTRQPYYLLKENETEGFTTLKVLDKDGNHVKNVDIEPNNVFLCDLTDGERLVTEIFGIDFNHSDLINIIAQRYNPFTKFHNITIKDDNDLPKLLKNLPDRTACVECSYGLYKPANFNGRGKDLAEKTLAEISKMSDDSIEYLKDIKKSIKNTRLIISSGNNSDELNCLLLNTGAEGVGGLNPVGKVSLMSGSGNSYFTQHYEPFIFPVTTTKYGVNISGLKGTDIDIPHDEKSGQYMGKLCGTSFSAPVRASKIALDEMLKNKI